MEERYNSLVWLKQIILMKFRLRGFVFVRNFKPVTSKGSLLWLQLLSSDRLSFTLPHKVNKKKNWKAGQERQSQWTNPESWQKGCGPKAKLRRSSITQSCLIVTYNKQCKEVQNYKLILPLLLCVRGWRFEGVWPGWPFRSLTVNYLPHRFKRTELR